MRPFLASSKSLEEIHRAHRGKTSDKWSGYFPIYDRLFAPFRTKPVSLLEIGIQNGGSLEVWNTYFRRARKIVGVDIDQKCAALRYHAPQIKVIVGDINTLSTRKAIAKASAAYDIIIDDGSHMSGDIIRTFCCLFPLLHAEGLFVVEDMCCAYWKDFDGGLFHPTSAMRFFQAVADCVNAEHWGNGMQARAHLEVILKHHGADLDNDLLSEIHAVEIANAVVTIRKRSADVNRMGQRIVSGADAAVVPEVLALDGGTWDSDEQSNAFAFSEISGPESSMFKFLHKKAAAPSDADENPGYCAVCESNTTFWVRDTWLRDHYLCRKCNSIPRMRAVHHVLDRHVPGWRKGSMHESSPSDAWLAKKSADYSASQYFGDSDLGALVDGIRNENLEALTFEDVRFDLFVTQDVLEHVFNPELACREIMRVLKPGGVHVFTTPKHRGLPTSYPRARLGPNGIEHLHPADYHGNPIGDGRALVTWDYGEDLEHLLTQWSGAPAITHVTRDRTLGLDGEYLEVFLVRKAADAKTPA